MKRNLVIIIAALICIVSSVFIFCSKKEETTYDPDIEEIGSFTNEKDNRYIILYSSENNKYYLGKVTTAHMLDHTLYDLGDTACNFKQTNKDLLIINSNNQIIYSTGDDSLLPDETYDVKALGNLIISYDNKNRDMQIIKRGSEAKCILKLKYYENFIPVDLIET